jgi:hypothetical protein
MRASYALLVATLLLSGCGSGGKSGNEAATAGNQAAVETDVGDALPSDFARLPMKEFMGHVMQFSGDQIWRWQGFINDEKGERSLFPKTDTEWEEAESGALALAEMTNILLLPGRRVDDPKWDEAVAGVRKVALEAAAASEKHDKDALFKIGGELDEACETCHVRFVPGYQGPPK